MARIDHYKNGEWVGSTDVEGQPESGWVRHYTSDGNTYSSYVNNSNSGCPNNYERETPNAFSDMDVSDFVWDGVSFFAGIWMLLMPIANIFYFLRLRRDVKRAKKHGIEPPYHARSLYSIGKFILIAFLFEAAFLALYLGVWKLLFPNGISIF